MVKKSVMKNNVGQAVLTRSGRVPVSAAKKSSPIATVSTSPTRPVNTATPKKSVNVSNSRRNTFHKSHSPIRRPFYKSTTPNTRILNEKVNVVRVNGVNTVGQTAISAVNGNGVSAIKASASYVWRPRMTNLISKRGNPQQALKNKGIFDIRCSRYMTGNKDFLTDYQEIDGGFVSFSGSTRGGKITGKGKIRTDKLDFEDVFFVKELKFKFFFVSQMCDKKNSVLFTETECLVLSPDFKLLGESQGLPGAYSTNTRKVEENLITAGNQTDKNVGPQETNGDTSLKKNVDVGQSEEENVSTQQYIMFPLWSSISSSYKSSDEKDGDDTADDAAGKKIVQKPANAVRKEFEAQCNRHLLQGKATRASSTNSFNTVSALVNDANTFRGVNAASASGTFSDAGPSFVPLGISFPIDVTNLPHDPLMPDLEDIAEVQSTGIFGNAYNDDDLDTYNYPYADQAVGAKAGFNNMELSTVVSLIPTTRVHFIHPKN
ncbi:hypothetical protein Tco_1437922 [Tanacetum coccineum]